MSKNVIACRPGCYDLPLEESLKLLKQVGMDGVEVGLPVDDDYAALADMARDIGIEITTLAHSGMKLDDPEHVEKLERGIEGAKQIGTGIIFLSSSMREESYENGIPILRDLAQKAHAAGVILSIETHTPFGHNGDTARRTIEAVGSPGIGHNFDTANIYYYNPKGISTTEELKKVLPYVSSVHLKESARGEPEEMDFPVLGTGIVDFPEVFRILEERGFTGPCTLELEGPLVDGLPVEERTEKVCACLEYLRSIGAMA